MGQMIFYSGSAAEGRGAFYDQAIHGANIPADAVRVTARRHRELLEQQGTGRRIVPDAYGKPSIAPLRKLGLDELRARGIARVKVEARRRILAVASLERQANDNAEIALAALEGGSPAEAIGRRRMIDRIRAASNTAEATIARMPAANLTDFDASADRLWPAQE